MAAEGAALSFAFSMPLGLDYSPRVHFALRSLRAQGVDIRLAYCDAGGSDESRKAADEYADLVAYRRHGPDSGQSAAINEGWRNVDGDFFSWLNGDDYLAPGALKHVSDIFAANEDVDIVYGQSYILDGDMTLGGLHPAVGGDIDVIFRHNLISQPSCFYRKSALEEVGMLKEDLHFTMDWDLWARFYAAGLRFHYTPEILSSVLWEKGTKTSGLSRRRMSEIAHLTGTYENPLTVAKTMIGFSLHHLFEYSAAGPILSGMRKRLAGTAAQRANMWRSPNDGASAIVPLYHFLNEKSARLCVRFADETNAVLALDGLAVELRREHEANLPAAILPGITTLLSVKASAEESPCISTIEFVADGGPA